MGLMELRAGALVEDADIVLIDGTLSGYIIKPPALICGRHIFPPFSSSSISNFSCKHLISPFNNPSRNSLIVISSPALACG